MGRTVSYYRSSTEQQENSVVMQEHKAWEYAAHHMLAIDHEYRDEHVSARKNSMDSRPSFAKLLQEIKAGNIKHLLVYKRDRLARNVEEHMKIYKLLRDCNVTVHFTSSNEVPMMYTPIGEYLELILGALCEHEGTQIAERIRNTKITNFYNGSLKGRLPYGYVAGEDGNISKIENEIEVVQYIFDEVLSQSYVTLNELRKSLDDMGIKKRSKPWKVVDIEKVVMNPLYMGTRLMKFNGKEYFKQYEHLSVVSEEEWDRANELIESMKRKRALKKEILFLLEKFLYCAHCKSHLIPKERMRKGNRRWFYECTTHQISVQKEWLEQQVWDYSCTFFTELLCHHTNEMTKRFHKEQKKQLQYLVGLQEQRIREKEEALGKRIEQWMERGEGTTYKKQALEEMKEHLQGVRKQKEVQSEIKNKLYMLEQFEEKLQTIRTKIDFHKSLEHLAPKEKQVLLEDMVYQIDIDAYEFHIIMKHPFLVRTELYQSES